MVENDVFLMDWLHLKEQRLDVGVKLMLSDTTRQEYLHSLMRAYYRGTVVHYVGHVEVKLHVFPPSQ